MIVNRELINEILQALNGLPVFVAGGSVRDLKLGRVPKDIDLVVLGEYDQEVADKIVQLVGQHVGSVLVTGTYPRGFTRGGSVYTLDDRAEFSGVQTHILTPKQESWELVPDEIGFDILFYNCASFSEALLTFDFNCNQVGLYVDPGTLQVVPLETSDARAFFTEGHLFLVRYEGMDYHRVDYVYNKLSSYVKKWERPVLNLKADGEVKQAVLDL